MTVLRSRRTRAFCGISPNPRIRLDRVFYFTTCGWMMWNWLIASLGAGATVVLYDGAPFSPNPRILWDLAEPAHSAGSGFLFHNLWLDDVELAHRFVGGRG